MKALWLGMGAALLANSAQAALTISGKTTENVSCSGGVCTATAKTAVLNVTNLANMIAASPVTIQAGSAAQDIVINAPFSWTGANGLTLDAYRSITVNTPVSDSGPAALTLTTNDGGKSGTLSFHYKGRVSFAATKNSLVINGQSYRLIKDIASLASAITENPAGFYALENRYDASKNGTYSGSPVATTFTGGFNGLGNTISGLTIVSDISGDTVGLFSTIAAGASVSSLDVSNVNISVSKLANAGAVAGVNNGLIFNDSADGSISGGETAFLGGLVGFNGSPSDSVVDLSHAAVDESGGEYDSAGGLVGGNYGQITRSYATGTAAAVNRKTNDGGLIGGNIGLIENCYALGDAEGGQASTVGGFAGNNANSQSASIATSYSTGKAQSVSRSGGFAGGNFGTVQNAYWDTTTSGTLRGVGKGNKSGITGLTDAQLKSGLPAGFDPAVWAQSSRINDGYPYLIDNPPPK